LAPSSTCLLIAFFSSALYTYVRLMYMREL
jgi:hypothetical protein